MRKNQIKFIKNIYIYILLKISQKKIKICIKIVQSICNIQTYALKYVYKLIYTCIFPHVAKIISIQLKKK